MNTNDFKYVALFCEKYQMLLERKLSDVKEKLALLQKSDSANIVDILRLREDEWSLNLDIFVFGLVSAYLKKIIKNSEV